MSMKLTPDGIDLLTRALAGDVNLVFKALVMGDGTNAGPNAAALTSQKLRSNNVAVTTQPANGYAILSATLINQGITTGFRATELGIIARHPTNQSAEILYAYEYTDSAVADYVPAFADRMLEMPYNVQVYVADMATITATIDAAALYATKGELADHIHDYTNPHRVTKEQVGLGNVPNTAPDDTVVTFTKASTLAEPNSGETLKTIFGKLKKAVGDLISHLANTSNPHSVTYTQAGAAAAVHNHAASDVTSGTLGVARGGTGKGSVTAGSYLVGDGTNAMTEKTPAQVLSDIGAAAASHNHAASDINSGILSADRGGTGNSNGYIQIGKASGTTVGVRATIEGLSNEGSGADCHVEGSQSKATGNGSHAEGIFCEATGNNASHAEGYMAKASGGFGAHAEGYLTEAAASHSHAEGWYSKTTQYAEAAHAEGLRATASGRHSHAEGVDTTASGLNSHAGGQGTIAAGDAQTAIGKYNVEDNASLFLVGCGTADDARANAFRVTPTGVYGVAAYATGADYAEMFEWQDGNPEAEDRRGRFVTLRGDKISLAGPSDSFILGIVSGRPSVCGDVYDDQWQGMYLTDVYGTPVWEDVEVPDETIERIDPETEETVVEVVVTRWAWWASWWPWTTGHASRAAGRRPARTASPQPRRNGPGLGSWRGWTRATSS